ncbi:MAG: DUF6273 domain-containing protein [bacterium]|nr:DUF6273 domain-containing protein [bacterium]
MDELRKIYADKRVGEHFEFGRYPQGADGEIKPILWRVLQRVIHPVSWRTTWRMLKREKEYLLILAEQGLDSKPYHEKFCGITWAECSLRRWLNAAFYNRAFNDQERALILQTYVINNAGPDTADHVFLLSINDAKRLFADDAARQAVPTDFALEKGARTSADFNIGNIGCCCWWWLRSRGIYDDLAADVGTDGGVYEAGSDVNDDFGCVRPALRIAL